MKVKVGSEPVVADAATDPTRIPVRDVGLCRTAERGINLDRLTRMVHPARARSYNLAVIDAVNRFRRVVRVEQLGEDVFVVSFVVAIDYDYDDDLRGGNSPGHPSRSAG